MEHHMIVFAKRKSFPFQNDQEKLKSFFFLTFLIYLLLVNKNKS